MDTYATSSEKSLYHKCCRYLSPMLKKGIMIIIKLLFTAKMGYGVRSFASLRVKDYSLAILKIPFLLLQKNNF